MKYTTFPQTVSTPFVHLTEKLQEFLSVLTDLSHRTGWCYAKASWLAQRFNITESQISRRLKQLLTEGLIEIQWVPGKKRLIRPVFFSPPAQTKRKPNADSLTRENQRRQESTTDRIAGKEKLSDVSIADVVVENVLQPPENIQQLDFPAVTAEETPPALVADLLAIGLEKQAAVTLAGQYAARCRAALAYLKVNRKTNPAGFLRRAVEKGWTLAGKTGPTRETKGATLLDEFGRPLVKAAITQSKDEIDCQRDRALAKLRKQ